MKRIFDILRWTILLSLTAFLFACTDGRAPNPYSRGVQYSLGNVELIADVQFQNNPTSALTMQTLGGSLFLSGTPFGFARWELSADPENPRLSFAASDNIDLFSPDPPFGGWRPDLYASKSMHAVNGWVFTSGMAGLSVISLASGAMPVETERYPRAAPTGEPIRDIAFIFNSMATHPSSPVLFGFSEMDYIYSYNASALPKLTLMGKVPYSAQGPVCCNAGAASFNNKLFLAMTNSLWVFNFLSNGAIQHSAIVQGLNAVDVKATANFLYIHHRPSVSGGSSLAEGIYVYDKTGVLRNQFLVAPLSFAVAPDDKHLYTNEDDQSVRIYKILWTN